MQVWVPSAHVASPSLCRMRVAQRISPGSQPVPQGDGSGESSCRVCELGKQSSRAEARSKRGADK